MFTKFSADVLDLLLNSVPDFQTLLSFILINKDTHAIFENRPNSIIRSVAGNLLGHALPQALRLARLEIYMLNNLDALWTTKITYFKESFPDETVVLQQQITHEEGAILARNAKVVEGLEAVYSFRHKNNKTTSSRLSDVESFRFHRALYRCWLFCHLFHRKSQFEGDEEGLEYADEEFEDHVGFFDTYPARDLAEITQVMIFMRDTAAWVDNATRPFSDSFRMANNPELLLGRFRISSAFPWAGKLWSPSRTSHWDTRESLEEALQTSQSPVPGSVLKTDKYILDEVNGEFDKCDRCTTITGVALWSSYNWHLLQGHISGVEILNCLPGNLASNFYEMNRLKQYIHSNFDPRWSINELSRSDTGDWSEGKQMCFACVLTLLGKRIMQWQLAHPPPRMYAPAMIMEIPGKPPTKEPDYIVRQDCERGYNCEMQNDSEHVHCFNHVCEPRHARVE